MHIIEHRLKNAYFVLEGQFYRQIEGAAMSSSLSPVIANLSSYFEKKKSHWISLSQIQTLYSLCQRHICNLAFAKDELIEPEENNLFLFLDILVTKKKEGTQWHTVYRKPVHTTRNHNAKFHHYPLRTNFRIYSTDRYPREKPWTQQYQNSIETKCLQ